jgi:peptidoglycan/LPS O-acetylase OafA/YrhL
MNIKTSNNINNLRWYFALTVVFTHFYKFYYLEFDNPIITWTGFLAVCGFILLSGYVNNDSIERSNSVSTFFRSRAIRILPMYYLSLIFSLFVVWLFDDVTWNDDWWLNFLFLQHIFNIDTINSNEPLWSLSYEFFLYLIFGLGWAIKPLKIVFLIIVAIYSYVSMNYLPMLLYTLFFLGVILSKQKIELDFISIPFFKLGNYTYEVYLFHYPILLIAFFKIKPFVINLIDL